MFDAQRQGSLHGTGQPAERMVLEQHQHGDELAWALGALRVLLQASAQQGREGGVMLLDGAGWHRAHALRVPDNLRLIALAPYSPELNPVEHVWDWLGENAIGNQIFADLDAVEDCLADGLKRLGSQPETLRSLTLFDWV